MVTAKKIVFFLINFGYIWHCDFLKPGKFTSSFVISSANNFSKLVIPYINLFKSYWSSKIIAIFREVFSISAVQNHKNSMVTFDCRNAPMKSNWSNLAFCLGSSVRKYFRVFIDAIGDQVSPIIFVFSKSPFR